MARQVKYLFFILFLQNSFLRAQGEENPLLLEEEKASLEDDRDWYESQADLSSVLQNRSDFNHGVAVGIGKTTPWQLITLSSLNFLPPNLAWTVDFGGGYWLQEANSTKEEASIKYQTYESEIGLRYFLPKAYPLFVQGALGYVFWQGRTLNLPKALKGTTDKQSLPFTAQGAVFSSKFGLMHIFQSGVFIEYTLVGVGKTAITKQNSPNITNELRGVLRNALNAPFIFGFINIKIGYMW